MKTAARMQILRTMREMHPLRTMQEMHLMGQTATLRIPMHRTVPMQAALTAIVPKRGN